MRADREKWDRRYGGGERPHDGPPSRFLRRWLPHLPRGRALDVASGLGRNALLLARAGYRVDAVDISPLGLRVASARAKRRGVAIRFLSRQGRDSLRMTAIRCRQPRCLIRSQS